MRSARVGLRWACCLRRQQQSRGACTNIVDDIRRRRAARLGLPEPEDVPQPAFCPGMSLGETIIAGRERRPWWLSNGDQAESRAAVEGLEDRLPPVNGEPIALRRLR